MTLSDMERAIDEAKADLDRADMQATRMARMLLGRLRKVESTYALGRLKRELSQYNAHTGQWKEEAK